MTNLHPAVRVVSDWAYIDHKALDWAKVEDGWLQLSPELAGRDTLRIEDDWLKLKSFVTVKVPPTQVEIRDTIAHRYGPIEYRPHLYVSDILGNKLGELDRVESAGVSMSNFRDTTWQLDLNMPADKDFNIFEDWVKATVEVKVMNEWLEYPMGLYRIKNPSADYSPGGRDWTLTGESSEILIAEDFLRYVYPVPAGTPVLAKVRELLLDVGVPPERINLPFQNERTTKTNRIFDPRSDESKAPRIRVINSLLNGSGFSGIWVDSTGVFTTRLYTDIRGEEPAVYYGNSPGEEDLVVGSVSDSFDDNRFANVIILREDNPNVDNPISAVAENNDPASAGSRRRLGYWKSKTYKMSEISDQASAQSTANSLLQVHSGYFRRMSWTTMFDVDRKEKEYYSMNIPGYVGAYDPLSVRAPELEGTEEEDLVSGPFRGNNFAATIHPEVGEMKFEGSKVEPVGS